VKVGRLRHLTFDDGSSHKPTGPLGVEANNLERSILRLVLKHRMNNRGLQPGPTRVVTRLRDRLCSHDLEILFGGEIHHQSLLSGPPQMSDLLVELSGHSVTPEPIQIGAARIGQSCAHLEPVWLEGVKRAQDTVESRENPQVLLRPTTRGGTKRRSIEPLIDVAVEGQQRRPSPVR